jgi:acetylornithine deacetylase
MFENPALSDVEKLLAQLVAFDTTSSKSNRACIDFIRTYLDTYGVRSEIVCGDDDNKACLWATIGPPDKSGIVLAGHSDVVPVDGQQWSSDPFTLTERQGRLYGRGSCDMKAFIACVLAVVPELTRAKHDRTIHLAFTHDEETDMSGALRLTTYLRNQGIVPDWVWIGEPTRLNIIDSHKGVALFVTDITGVSGHSGNPDKGLNAIELGAQFIDIIRQMALDKKRNPFRPSRFDPPYTTFNLGIVNGGTAENIIAEHCQIHWQVRLHPGDDLQKTIAVIESGAEKEFQSRFAAFLPHAGIKTCTCFDIPPLLPSKNNRGEALLKRLTGQTETQAVSFGTEGGFFQKLGTHVIICGPGSIEQAHQPDEYVEKSQLSSCVDLLRKVLLSSAHG